MTDKNDKDYCIVADEYECKCIFKHKCSTCPVLNDESESSKED